MNDKEYLGLHRGDTIYALEYGSQREPEIGAYTFETRATGGRIIASKPSVLRPGEEEVFRLHASTAYLTPQGAALAHVAEARRAIPYFELRLGEAKRKLDAALSWAEQHGVELKDP